MPTPRLGATPCAFILAALISLPATAGLTQVTGDNFSASGLPAFDAMGVLPFDPSLGTLDAVQVTLTGTVTVSGVTPATMPFTVEQRFFGLAGRFFEFDSPAVMMGTAVATVGPSGPVPTAFQHTFPFSYDFTFNASTDLVGYVPVNSPGAGILPPISISAQRADFHPWVGSHYEIDTVVSFGSGPVSSIATSGALLMQYHYTPVPEPAGLSLLLGLSAMTLRRRAPCSG